MCVCVCFVFQHRHMVNGNSYNHEQPHKKENIQHEQ